MKKLLLLLLALAPVALMANTPKKAITFIYTENINVADTLSIEPKDADKHIGEVVRMEGKVASAKVFSSTALLNIGGEYPNQLLTVVLKGELIPLYKAGTKPTVKAVGKLALRNGKPEMVITDKKDIVITD